MDFEKHFDYFDTLSEKEKEKEKTCCSQRENVQIVVKFN